MFNRNARNRLNTMGGIASFSNGGATSILQNPTVINALNRRGIPTSSLGVIQSQLPANNLNRFLNQNRTNTTSLTRVGGNAPKVTLTGEQVKQIARNRLNQPKFPEGLASFFTPEKATSPGGFIASSIGKGIATGADKTAQGVANLLNVFKPFSGMTPGVRKELEKGGGNVDLTGVDLTKIPGVTNIEGYEKFKRPIGMIPGTITKIVPEGSKGPKPFPDPNVDKTSTAEDFTDSTMIGLDQEGGVAQGIDQADKVDTTKQDKVKTKKDDTTTADKVVPKPTTKENVEKLITTGSPEEQQSELKQLMSEFKQNAPEYEGMDKNLALAKVFFSIAAGKDPDAITNIADGLNKGADMFLKDKKERDAFNRQVDLAALRYGLQERSKDRAQKFFIADQEVTVDGKKYAKGDVVSLTSGFIRKNGIPSGLTTETLTKAAMDNAASIKKALDKLSKDKIMSPKDFNTFSKRVDDAALNFTKSRNLQTLIQGQIFNVSEGKITGGLNAGKALVKKAFDFAQIDMGKKYSSIDEYNRDMEEVANTLIQQILGEGSKNLSNVDRSLAQQIVGLYTSGAKGVTGYAFINDDVLLKRLQRINDKVKITQQNSLAEIEDVLAATNGLTFQSGQAVKFAKVRDLGLYGKIQGTATDKGAKTQTVKLGDLFSDGKFDKDKFNKLLIG